MTLRAKLPWTLADSRALAAVAERWGIPLASPGQVAALAMELKSMGLESAARFMRQTHALYRKAVVSAYLQGIECQYGLCALARAAIETSPDLAISSPALLVILAEIAENPPTRVSGAGELQAIDAALCDLMSVLQTRTSALDAAAQAIDFELAQEPATAQWEAALTEWLGTVSTSGEWADFLALVHPLEIPPPILAQFGSAMAVTPVGTA